MSRVMGHTESMHDFCEWTIDTEMFEGIAYETSCNDSFLWGDFEKLPKQFKYCPYCGKRIKVSKNSG